MARIKMTVEYDGSRYHGFQIQHNAHTVQAELESAIEQVGGEKVTLLCSGRTDAGVHALGQVIAFDSSSRVPADRWNFALNRFLPPDIQVLTSALAAPDFHPRYHALSKVYHYLIYRQRQGRIFNRNYAYSCTEALDLAAMREAVRFLEGVHDFKAFCASGSSVKTFERRVIRCVLLEEEPYIKLIIEANGFLYNMVRIIMGTVLEVGRGNYPPSAIEPIIASRDRSQAGPTAPPQGLYLVEVKYSGSER